MPGPGVSLPTRISLVSRRWVPREMLPDADDVRLLGVALADIRFDGCPIALDDPRLSSGWHAPEAGWRWTDGAAGVAVAGVRTLSFTIALTGSYWMEPRREGRAIAFGRRAGRTMGHREAGHEGV